MNLRDTFASIILVDSHARQRPEPVAPEPVPEAGVQFGRPSTFSFSAAAADSGAGSGPGFVIELPDRSQAEYMRIIRAPGQVLSQEVRVKDPVEPGTSVDISRFERLRFAFTEYLPKPRLSSLQPTLRTEYDLTFKLHPDGEDLL